MHAQLSIEDHLGMESIQKVSVHAGSILFQHRTKESWDGATTSAIGLMSISGAAPTMLTSGGFDYDPQWSPDGSLVSFISYRNNLQQIYTVPRDGGDPTMVSDAQAYISGYTWLNDSTIAYVDDEPRDSQYQATADANGGGYWVGTEFFTNAAWACNIHSKERRRLTDSSFRVVELNASSDGQFLAMVCAKNYDTFESITNSWVQVMDVARQEIVFTYQLAESPGQLAFSPSGKKLSFVGSTTGFAAKDALLVVDLTADRPIARNLTYELDPTIDHCLWLDDETLLLATPQNTFHALYRVSLSGKAALVGAPHWVIYSLAFAKKQLYFVGSHATQPSQIYRLDLEKIPASVQALTTLNAALQSRIHTQSKPIQWSSYDGTPVEGVLVFPPHYDSTRRYPLMVIPHGGPDAVVMNDFNWMKQWFADQGYLVLLPNFRGSIGYGRDFYAGNRNAFGLTDYQDILSGVDKLVNDGRADPQKLVIGGWSYGGYMANWVITQTDRFRAAISVAGISNLVSLYGQHEFSNRDIGVWEYKGTLVDSVENYRRPSPLFYVDQAETPLLILHGERDAISPTLQAWEMYRAMKDAGKEVQMMLYPGAGHNISRPQQFKSVLEQWVRWADEHINKG